MQQTIIAFIPPVTRYPSFHVGVEVDIEGLIRLQKISVHIWTWALRLYDAYNLTDNWSTWASNRDTMWYVPFQFDSSRWHVMRHDGNAVCRCRWSAPLSCSSWVMRQVLAKMLAICPTNRSQQPPDFVEDQQGGGVLNHELQKAYRMYKSYHRLMFCITYMLYI